MGWLDPILSVSVPRNAAVMYFGAWKTHIDLKLCKHNHNVSGANAVAMKPNSVRITMLGSQLSTKFQLFRLAKQQTRVATSNWNNLAAVKVYKAKVPKDSYNSVCGVSSNACGGRRTARPVRVNCVRCNTTDNAVWLNKADKTATSRECQRGIPKTAVSVPKRNQSHAEGNWRRKHSA